MISPDYPSKEEEFVKNDITILNECLVKLHVFIVLLIELQMKLIFFSLDLSRPVPT